MYWWEGNKNDDSIYSIRNRSGSVIRDQRLGRDPRTGGRAFSDIQYSDNDTRNAELLILEKPVELREIEARGLAIIARYDDPTITTATMHLAGILYLNYATLLDNSPAPSMLDEHEITLYRETISELSEPTTNTGISHLKAALLVAEDASVWTEWSEQSQALLAEYVDEDEAPRLRWFRRR